MRQARRAPSRCPDETCRSSPALLVPLPRARHASDYRADADKPFVDPSRKYVGGTTIAGTSIVAHMAGIKVFATGGLGGVHRGVEKSMDVSADLTELGRTNIAVICSGSKAFLDLEKTLEYLETEGVYVGTFGDRDSPEPVPYPAFYSRDAGLISPSVVGSAEEAAAIICEEIPVLCGREVLTSRRCEPLDGPEVRTAVRQPDPGGA